MNFICNKLVGYFSNVFINIQSSLDNMGQSQASGSNTSNNCLSNYGARIATHVENKSFNNGTLVIFWILQPLQSIDRLSPDFSHFKGQLISKCPFGVFKSQKKKNREFFQGFLPQPLKKDQINKKPLIKYFLTIDCLFLVNSFLEARAKLSLFFLEI